MKVFHGTDNLPEFRDPVVTVGSFDGLHLGHMELISATKQEAARSGGESIVVTFSPHPRLVLSECPSEFKLITTDNEKTVLLSQTGIDGLIILPFNREFSKLTAQEFLDNYLIQLIGTKKLITGYNHRFGSDRLGSCQISGNSIIPGMPDVIVIPEKITDGRKISSTEVRNLILNGRTGEAAALLGHYYFISGRVSDAVLTPHPDKLLPPPGDYGVTCYFNGDSIPMAITIHDGILRFDPGSGSVPVNAEVIVVFK